MKKMSTLKELEDIYQDPYLTPEENDILEEMYENHYEDAIEL